MKCVICKNGETEPGFTTVTLDKDGSTLIVKNVPAEICENCGEYYLEQEVTGRVLTLSKQAREEGAELKVLRYSQEPAMVATE
jgi:YgiT-type zinc finger domain-containing protein